MKVVHLDIGVRIYQISPSFVFCHGEISKSNFKSYLEQLPLIDLVYAALPKPENFLFWYKLAKRAKINHNQFFSGLCNIWNDTFKVKIGTSPLVDDTDGDGYYDGIEVQSASDPLDPNDFPGVGEDEKKGIPEYSLVFLASFALTGIILVYKKMKLQKI